MAITKQAKRFVRSSARKAVFNLRRKREMREFVKQIQDLIAKKDAKAASALLPQVQKAIDKAVKRGVIKENTGARKKSRIVAAIKRIG